MRGAFVLYRKAAGREAKLSYMTPPWRTGMGWR